MQKPGIPENLNDRVIKQHLGLIHISFGVDKMELVNRKSEEIAKAGFRILRGPRKTGDGYYEFETLDPDNNRIEVAAIFEDKP
jgi:lactoylglutathione lyase